MRFPNLLKYLRLDKTDSSSSEDGDGFLQDIQPEGPIYQVLRESEFPDPSLPEDGTTSTANTHCIKYFGASLLTPAPPDPRTSPVSLTKSKIFGDSSTVALELSDNEILNFLPANLVPGDDDENHDQCRQKSTSDQLILADAAPQSLSQASSPDQNRGRSSTAASVPRASLRRSQSQAALALRPEHSHTEISATSPRRRSLSHVSHPRGSDSFVRPASPMEVDLEKGMLKLEFAKAQRDMEQPSNRDISPAPHSSNSGGDQTPSNDGESIDSARINPSSSATSSEEEDDSTQSMIEDSSFIDAPAGEEKAMLLDQIATLTAEMKGMEEKHTAEIADKEETSGMVVSMYQVAMAKIEDLETKAKQAGMKQSQKIVSDPALVAELMELRRTTKVQAKELLELRDTNQLQAMGLSSAGRRIESLVINLEEAELSQQEYAASLVDAHEKIDDLEKRLAGTRTNAEVVSMKDFAHVVRRNESLGDDLAGAELSLDEAIEEIDDLKEQLAANEASTDHKDDVIWEEVKNLEEKLTKAEATNREISFEKQGLEQKLMGANEKIRHTGKEVVKHLQLARQTTSKYIDIKSECERLSYQNTEMREALALDPARAAHYDNTIKHLKSELGFADKERMVAEEAQMLAEQDLLREKTKSGAEITRLTEENRMLSVSFFNMSSSKRALRKGIQKFYATAQKKNVAVALSAGVDAFHATLRDDEAQDTQVRTMVELQSAAEQKAANLESRCFNLQETVDKAVMKAGDLEREQAAIIDARDFAQIQELGKVREHEEVVKGKDEEITELKRDVRRYKGLFNAVKDGETDWTTNWFLRYQEKRLNEAEAKAGNAIQAATEAKRDLAIKIAAEKEDADLQVLTHWRETIYGLHPAPQDEVAELKEQIQSLEKGWCTPEMILWTDHVKRVEEVRAETAETMRDTLETEVKPDVFKKVGDEYVTPMCHLIRYLWARNYNLESELVRRGEDGQVLLCNGRLAMMNITRQLGIMP